MNEKNSQVEPKRPPSPAAKAVGIAEAFAAHGIPLTRQRRILWQYFAQSGRAATMKEAIEDMRQFGIGQATVYRTVNILVELGLLFRLQSLSGEVCYTATQIGHTHPLVCGHCRRVIGFDGENDLADLQARLQDETGFSIYGHYLVVYGLCPDCSQGKEA